MCILRTNYLANLMWRKSFYLLETILRKPKKSSFRRGRFGGGVGHTTQNNEELEYFGWFFCGKPFERGRILHFVDVPQPEILFLHQICEVMSTLDIFSR